MRSWGVAAAAAAAVAAGDNRINGRSCKVDKTIPSPTRRLFPSSLSACRVRNICGDPLPSNGPQQQKQQRLQHDHPTQQQQSLSALPQSSEQQQDRSCKHQQIVQRQENCNHLQRPPRQHAQPRRDQQRPFTRSSRSWRPSRTLCKSFDCPDLQRGRGVPLGSRLTQASATQQQQQQHRLLLLARTRDCSCEFQRERRSSSSTCSAWLQHEAAPLVRCYAAETVHSSRSNSSGDNSSSSSSVEGMDTRGSDKNTKVNCNSKDATSRTTARQQVLVWGSRAAFPGGAEADVMQPQEVSWFADAARARGAAFTRLSFGPSFGVAVNSRGEAAIWGSFDAALLPQQLQSATAAADLREAGAAAAPSSDVSAPAAAPSASRSSLCFAGPVFLKLPFAVRDAQCSAAEIFFLSDCGRVYYLESDLLRLLRDAHVHQQQQEERKQKHEDAQDPRKEKEEQQHAGVEDLRADPVEMKGFPARSLSGRSPSWISWLGSLLPYWNARSSDRVKKMSVGHSHAAFLTEAGELYMCGSNTFGECGVEPDPFDASTLHVHLNKVNFSSTGRSQQQLQASNQQQQQSRQWRRQEEEPFIVDVACGRRHTLCLSRAGEAYAFGDDSKIELGLGDTRSQQQTVVGTTWMERLAGRTAPTARRASYSYAERHLQATPQRVMKPSTLPAAHNCMATAVAAGDDFSLVLYEDIEQSYPDPLLKRNTLLCCGETALGQCGRGLQFHQQPLAAVVFPRAASAVSFNRHAAPGVHAATSRYIEGPSLVYKVDKFRCGSSHCNALMSSGKLVGWGFNPHGQVGTGPKVKGPISPAKIIDLDNEKGSRDKTTSSSNRSKLSSSSSSTKPKTFSEADTTLASEEQLTPPLPRFLRNSAAERFKVQDIFCKFDSSAVIRALAKEGPLA